MSKHTQEPWFHHKPAGCQHTSGGYINNSASRNIDAICHVYGGDTGLADASRIVTCVNACAGMEDPAAEIDELKQQRDELLGLVKAVVYHSVPVTVNGTRCAAFPWVEYEAMVNKTKGGAA